MPIACACSASQSNHRELAPLFKSAVISRNLHRWLGLLVGIQVLIWLASGLYMVVVDIDFIHGDSLVKNMQQEILVPEPPQLGVADLKARFPDATQISLKPLMGTTVYAVATTDSRYLIDPGTGALLSPLGEDTARQIARYHFAGTAAINHTALITTDPPMEIQTRSLPLWRVDFDDRFATSFYIDPNDGDLVTRRHQYWRIFDFLWMLHIMDYENRSDAHNPLLITAQISGLTFAISGLWLLFYSFSGRRRKATKQRPDFQ